MDGVATLGTTFTVSWLGSASQVQIALYIVQIVLIIDVTDPNTVDGKSYAHAPPNAIQAPNKKTIRRKIQILSISEISD